MYNGDLISREQAIEKIKSVFEWHDVVTVDRLVEHIKALPSAQKTGKWKKHVLKDANVQWGYDCSSCGEWFVIGQDYIKRYKHCPNCGAKMEEDQ